MEPLLGFFLNTLALRTDCSGDPTFRELLRRVRTTTLEAYANQDVPFEMLIEELQPERDLGGTPLVQVLFTLEDVERAAIVRTLAYTRGNKRAAADILGVYRPTLYAKMRKYGLMAPQEEVATA